MKKTKGHMRHCPACGRDYRTGGTVCLVLAPSGAARQTVCRKCGSRGVTVVAPLGDAPAAVDEDGAAKAFISDVMRVRRQLRTYATLARNRARVTEDEHEGAHQLGRAEGYEGALHAIDQEVRGVSP